MKLRQWKALLRDTARQAHARGVAAGRADVLAVLKAAGKGNAGPSFDQLCNTLLDVLRKYDDDDRDGLCVYAHPDGPAVWVDQMDWHEGESGRAVIKAAERTVGVEASERRYEPGKAAVHVCNEGPKPPGDGWVNLIDRLERPSQQKATTDTRPTAAVDLDGTLARYDGWKGVEHFGDPLPGATDFLTALGRTHRVLVFTTRTKADDPALLRSNAQNAPALASLVRGWLDRHGLPYDDVYTGQGKPLAAVYVDDRAVPVPTNPTPDDYQAALAVIAGRSEVKAAPAADGPHAALTLALLDTALAHAEAGTDATDALHRLADLAADPDALARAVSGAEGSAPDDRARAAEVVKALIGDPDLKKQQMSHYDGLVRQALG